MQWVLITFFCISVSAQQGYTINGYGKSIKDGDILYMSYRVNGKLRLDSAIARDNRFSFSGVVPEIIKASIYRNENPLYVDYINESVTVYLHPGAIKITSEDTLTGAVVGGTGLNDTLQLLQDRLLPLKEKSRAVKDPDFFTDEQKRDTALVNSSKKKLEAIFYEMADAEILFAKEYPDSYVSLDILANRSRINTYINKIEEAYNHLSPSLQQTPQGRTIAETIRKKKQLVPGMKAFEFTMNSPEEKSISLSSLSGKYILLDFWASWCGPCREEHPNIIAAYQKYKDKGFTIMSVSIDTDKEKWVNAIAQDKISWTQVSDLKGNEGPVYLKYGITSIPANFLISPEGVIIAKDLKGDALNAKLKTIFAVK
jgi:thiol-disulfide isomerase/thioredoxin